jgi:hypothetical protein
MQSRQIIGGSHLVISFGKQIFHGARLWFSPDAAELPPGLRITGKVRYFHREELSLRAIMLALAATFIFSGTMAGITTVRAQDSTTVIKHDDGDKTVIKKYNDDDADKKVIIKKHDD